MDQQIKKQIKQKELFQPCPLHEREYLNIVCIDVICLNNGIICRICQSISHKAHGWFTLEDFIDILIKQEDDKTQLLNQEYQQLQDWFIKAKALDDQLKEIIDQIRRQLDHFKSFNQTIVDQIKSQITLCQMNSSIAARIKSNMILNVPNLQVFMNGLIQSFHSQYKPNYDNQQIQNLIDYGKYIQVKINLIQQTVLELKLNLRLFKEQDIQWNKNLEKTIKLDILDKKCYEIHKQLKEIFEVHLKEKHQEIFLKQINNWNYLYEIQNKPREFEWWLWYGDNPLQNELCKICFGIYQTNRVHLHKLDKERRLLIQEIFDKFQ